MQNSVLARHHWFSIIQYVQYIRDACQHQLHHPHTPPSFPRIQPRITCSFQAYWAQHLHWAKQILGVYIWNTYHKTCLESDTIVKHSSPPLLYYLKVIANARCLTVKALWIGYSVCPTIPRLVSGFSKTSTGTRSLNRFHLSYSAIDRVVQWSHTIFSGLQIGVSKKSHLPWLHLQTDQMVCFHHPQYSRERSVAEVQYTLAPWDGILSGSPRSKNGCEQLHTVCLSSNFLNPLCKEMASYHRCSYMIITWMCFLKCYFVSWLRQEAIFHFALNCSSWYFFLFFYHLKVNV